MTYDGGHSDECIDRMYREAGVTPTTQPPTPDSLLATLRDLDATMTPGPWHRHTYGHGNLTDVAAVVTKSIGMGEYPNTDATWLHTDDTDDADERPSVAFVGNGPKQTENGDGIATLRNLLPDLIARLERADRVETALRHVVSCVQPNTTTANRPIDTNARVLADHLTSVARAALATEEPR